MPLKSPSFPKKERLSQWIFTINRFWILTLFTIILGVLALEHSTKALTPISSDILYRCTNAIRQTNHQPQLYLNEQLNQAAALKLKDMEQYGYWAHQNPETGKQPWEFVDEAGYYYKTAGENLAIGYKLSEEICDAWQKSPSHFANLINPNFQEVGFAFQEVELNKEKSGILVVQMFGTKTGFERKKLVRERCPNRMKKDLTILYPHCGILEKDDPIMILYNPKGHDLEIQLDGQKIPSTLSTYGDYYRYEFSEPFTLGSHQMNIRIADSARQAARLKFIVTEKPDKVASESFSELLAANLLMGQNTSGYCLMFFILIIAGAGLFMQRRKN